MFDVKAVSDRAIPGVLGMRKLSGKLIEIANKAARGAGRNLHFFFFERHDYCNTKRHRTIHAPPDHKISDNAAAALSAFVRSEPVEGASIDIVDGEMIVRVTWSPGTSQLFKYRSSTVNEIFDVEDNYIAAALREKARQLRSPHFTGIKGVLLADIGSATLKRLDGIDLLGRSVSGRRIIQHYLGRPNGGLDFVCVFSPCAKCTMTAPTQHFWQVTLFAKQEHDLPMDGLNDLVSYLPPPRFDGNQLEHLHEQRLFSAQSRGWYLGSKMTGNVSRKGLTTTFSARALHEFLAGRIDGDRLRAHLIGGTGAYEYQLARGHTIKGARVVPGGIDEDDDLIELIFAPDPAASAYENHALSAKQTDALHDES